MTSNSRFGVTSEDLRRYDWQERLARHPRKECRSYFQVFIPAADECATVGDDLGCRVYSFLNTVASFHPVYGRKGNPYQPVLREVDGTRSLMAEDLADSDLDALSGIVTTVTDAEFRARISDVLWACRRDFKAAQSAVDAFLESAATWKTDDLWPPYEERLSRAAQLGKTLGSGKPYHQKAIAAVEDGIKEFENNPKAGLLCHRLMCILLAHGMGDGVRYAALAEKLAGEMANRAEYDFSHAYSLLAADWFHKLKNQAERDRCTLAAAESLVAKAENERDREKFGLRYSAHWMGRALEALRQARADANRIKEIHLRFLDLQQRAQGDFKTIELDSDKIDQLRASEKQMREAAANHVHGLRFEDAVARFVHITRPTDLDSLVKEMESASKGLIWHKIVGLEALDTSGKVADTLPPSGVESPDDAADAQRKRAVLQARETRWPLASEWLIEPARATIVSEHGIRPVNIAFIVTRNPFIPPGHEGIYLRGLMEGFLGDWLVSMHLLIPQVEASLRHILQQHGFVTSILESDGTQKERDLNQLLWMEELGQILDPNTLFDLRGILIERFGHNMRNESAHGLMPEAAFFQPAAVYLWWLVLRLCWYGFAAQLRASNQPQGEVSKQAGSAGS